GPRQPLVAGDRLESAATAGTGNPARRGGHRRLVYPALASAKKGAHRKGQTIVWVDESGFYLLPALVRTYAPRAQTPILHVPLTHDHLSVISGITRDDRLLLMAQDSPLHSPEVVRFLQHLLRHIPGKVLVIWDGAPIHTGQPVKDFLASGGAARLQL